MTNSENNRTPQFLKLFVNNQKAIYSYIFAMVYDEDIAADILQDTVAVMWERFKTYQEGTSFGAWGISIARYKLFDYFKKNRKKYASISDELLERISQTTQQRLETIDDRTSALRECLKKLTKQDRKLISIRYEQGMKVKDIAGKINRPIQGLYQAMSRIHHTLLRCIETTISRWECDL
jgi:RNA polymerase sigma-70 factor (ECF subfamily)